MITYVTSGASLPGDEEVVRAETAETYADAMLLSAIDPRFDQQLMDRLRHAVQGAVIFVPNPSRLSRNIDNLLRVIEFVLAHGLLKSDYRDPLAVLRNTAIARFGFEGWHYPVPGWRARGY